MIFPVFLAQAAPGLSRIASRFAGSFGAACLCIYFVTMAAVSWVAPGSNWDLIAYVAVSIEHRFADAAALHREAYALVQAGVSPGEFLVLTADRPYRAAQFESASAFVSMLGFYRAKFLYVELSAWLSTYLNPVDALRLIATASFLAIGGVVTLWTASRGLLGFGPLIVALMVLVDLSDMVRHVTPDLFAGLFVILGILAFVRGNDIVAAVALSAATLSRPDHAALLGCMLLVCLVIRRGVAPFALATIASAIATIWISQVSDHPGWWVHMWFNFVEGVPTLEGFDPPFSIVTYGAIVAEVIVRSLIDETWLALSIVLCALAIALLRSGWRPELRVGAVLVAVLLCEFGKLIISPFDETRFHFAYLAAAGLLLIEAVAQKWPVETTGHQTAVQA